MTVRPQSLPDWLDFIGRQHHAEMALGLERVRKLAGRLGLLTFSCPVVTVAGTNGKGSSIAMLESIYLAAGYRTGAYTSPHLTVFNERIRIAGEHCSDDDLCRAFERIEQARSDIPLTYFEYATLAALEIFSSSAPDILLLETGLGGRLDAVNILHADVAVITRIGIDHVQWLGNDREDIGREKAGIIHAGSVAVIADPDPPASLLAMARKTARRQFRLGHEFRVGAGQEDWIWHGPASERLDLPLPPMPGRVQLDNAAGVVMAVNALRDRLPVTEAAIREGLANTALGGRFQVVGKDPLIVLDVAHNADSAAVLADNLAAQPVSGRTLAVFGMLGDKDAMTVIEKLTAVVDAWFVGALDVPRSARTAELTRLLNEAGGDEVKGFATIEQAWADARAKADPDDRIVVFGSFHAVGAIISSLSHPEQTQ